MKRSVKFAAVAALGGVVVAGPAVAVAATSDPGPGHPAAVQVMQRAGEHGQQGWTAMNGPAHGTGTGTCTAPSGTLSTEQRTTLLTQAEEEKLAHDLYTAFAAKYGDPVFERIAAAETRHLDAVRMLLDRYGLTDPTAGKADGVFSDPAFQSRYDQLLARGSASVTAALEVGRGIEQADVTGLGQALDGLGASDVHQVYEHLLAASNAHLTAFERQLS